MSKLRCDELLFPAHLLGEAVGTAKYFAVDSIINHLSKAVFLVKRKRYYLKVILGCFAARDINRGLKSGHTW